MLSLEILGTIAADAEVKESGGRPYAYFRVFSQEKKVTGGGYNTTWVTVFWSNGYDRVLPYLTKGTKVFVRGLMRAGVHTLPDGKNEVAISCGASEVSIIFEPKPKGE